jgi:hypothetical protein
MSSPLHCFILRQGTELASNLSRVAAESVKASTGNWETSVCELQVIMQIRCYQKPRTTLSLHLSFSLVVMSAGEPCPALRPPPEFDTDDEIPLDQLAIPVQMQLQASIQDKCIPKGMCRVY